MTSDTSAPTIRRVFVPGLVLAAWTLLLWTTRVRNILADDALTGWSRTWQLGAAVGFVVAGVGLGVLSLLRPALALRPGLALALFGAAWWIVRGTGVVLADHPLGFTVVHVALAAGTVAIGAWLVRSVLAGGETGTIRFGRAGDRR